MSERKLYHYGIDNLTPVSVFSRLHHFPYSLFFDSSDTAHPLARYSFAIFHPFETIEARNGRISVTNKEQQLSFTGDPFEIVGQRLEAYGEDVQGNENLPPFQGGAAGYFGYDLARAIENLPCRAQERPDVPDMVIGLYDQVYAYDHEKKKGYFITHATSDEEAQARFRHFGHLIDKGTGVASHANEAPLAWRSSHTRNAYEKAVEKVRGYIYAGDIFQANLSQRFEAELPPDFDAYAHYRLLRDVNGAPFGGYMNFGGVKLASCSPERFLSLDGRRRVETCPIKGTSPRGQDSKTDKAYREWLENSAKDKAENTMIVDLLRNDLSKVCEDHSITVPQLCQIESFAGVHHLVSRVTGSLRADRTALDLLRACFPGGSITGAPKVRAMEIIEELEPVRRGPYCGAMGYIGFNGVMDSNIVIRTLVYEGRTVSLNVGGGIVADSVAADEYEETLSKADAIFRSFEQRKRMQETA